MYSPSNAIVFATTFAGGPGAAKGTASVEKMVITNMGRVQSNILNDSIYLRLARTESFWVLSYC